ncbi:hypothetical protein SAMD00023378_3895 [Ralstonia sp. NT80]|nr:hypothetical protein SAMD00023378_3895 [Ralstonia sp. NT80]
MTFDAPKMSAVFRFAPCAAWGDMLIATLMSRETGRVFGMDRSNEKGPRMAGLSKGVRLGYCVTLTGVVPFGVCTDALAEFRFRTA